MHGTCNYVQVHQVYAGARNTDSPISPVRVPNNSTQSKLHRLHLA